MAQRLDGFVLFSTQMDGFNQDEVGAYIAKIHQQYEQLYKENERLKRQLKRAGGNYKRIQESPCFQSNKSVSGG